MSSSRSTYEFAPTRSRISHANLTTDKAGRIHRDVDYGRITTATRPANPALANAVESRDATATVTE